MSADEHGGNLGLPIPSSRQSHKASQYPSKITKVLLYEFRRCTERYTVAFRRRHTSKRLGVSIGLSDRVRYA